ncbi:MAG: patatin-like phospholipase family protein, partial [Actinobacteria bacterium]|nr:patatin-like phospholipase family protein [Actinomycetota bacterium]
MADSTKGNLALVFSGGGARAAYQVGALLGIAERAGEGFRFPIVTGVSAGAINAARIASAETSLPGAARALADGWMALSVRRVFNPGLFALLYSGFKAGVLLTTAGRLPGFPVRGLLNTKPLRRTMSRFLQTEGIDANIAAGRLRALALTATSYATGHTVTFVQGSDDVPT